MMLKTEIKHSAMNRPDCLFCGVAAHGWVLAVRQSGLLMVLDIFTHPVSYMWGSNLQFVLKPHS